MNKPYIDLLKHELEKPIKASAQAWRLLERLAEAFIAMSDDVNDLSTELYGNGVPGGMKIQLIRLLDDVAEIKEKLLPMKGSTFDTFVKWFVDKVLPALIVFAITSFIQVSVFVIAFLVAVVNGWITIH